MNRCKKGASVVIRLGTLCVIEEELKQATVGPDGKERVIKEPEHKQSIRAGLGCESALCECVSVVWLEAWSLQRAGLQW